MVRSLLLNQDEFRFHVGLTQLFAGLVIMMLALDNIRKDQNMWHSCIALSEEPDFNGILDYENKVYPPFRIFMKVYVRVGFKNVFEFGE
jgi:hypothetical protein